MTHFRRWALACLLLFVGACSVSSDNDDSAGGSETHWLESCGDGTTCGGATSCICELCTLVCEDDSDCAPLGPSAKCSQGTGDAAAAVCGEGAELFSGICLRACSTEVDCDDGERCTDERCVPEEPDPESTADVSPTPLPTATPGAPTADVVCTGMQTAAVCPEPEGFVPSCELDWQQCTGGQERRVRCEYRPNPEEGVRCECIADAEIVREFDFSGACPWTIQDADPEALGLCGWELAVTEAYPTPWPGIEVPCP